MTEELKQINKIYDENINASYFSSLLTSRTQKEQTYENIIKQYLEYLSKHNDVESSVKLEIYKKIKYLYEYTDKTKSQVIEYKLKCYELLSDGEFNKSMDLEVKNELNIHKLLDAAENDTIKIRIYKYLINNSILDEQTKHKYIISFIDYYNTILNTTYDTQELKNELIPHIKNLFISNLKTTNAKKYAKLLITLDKKEYFEYCCKTDPLISNIDYYKTL